MALMNSSPGYTPRTVTVLAGDGVGPEVVAAATTLVEATGAPITWEYADAGGVAFERGVASGVPDETVSSIARNGIVLKGPLATPIGHGQKSANVTLRKLFETFANIRPARELPGITTPFSGRGVDLVIVRENIEDLYAGIEHMQTPNVAQCLKLISRLGSQRIAHAALSYAAAHQRQTITVATKANIMKLTEGMFKRECEAAAATYPGITAQHMLVDNLAHQMVIAPEQFDVVVTTNMNGDILSDLASGLVGGLGVAPSANIGYDVQMFEAVHGTAPDIAGANVVNPTAMILSAVMMLRQVNLPAHASALEAALQATLAQGIHTADLGADQCVGTQQFTDAIAQRLGTVDDEVVAHPEVFSPPVISAQDASFHPQVRTTWGVDIFIETEQGPDEVGRELEALVASDSTQLVMVSNRGTQVWPAAAVGPTCVDHYRCRFQFGQSPDDADAEIMRLMSLIAQRYRWMHVEKLELHDGDSAFSKAQGQNESHVG